MYHESDTRNLFFRPISEEIARLLICVLSHDDVIASGAWYIVANLKKAEIL